MAKNYTEEEESLDITTIGDNRLFRAKNKSMTRKEIKTFELTTQIRLAREDLMAKNYKHLD